MMRRLTLIFGVALLAGCEPSPHDLAGSGKDDAVEKLAALLEKNPEQISELNDKQKTPLHFAVTYNRNAATEFLLNLGADVNAQDVTGMTPLHCAVTLDRLDEAELLVAAGADIEARDNFGDTPLHTAALHGRVKSINWLVSKGADVSALNDEGLSALDLARREHKSEVAERLETLIAR